MTEEVELIKQEMIESLEAKYEELLKTGISEEECLQYIQNNFGDIDELKREYQISTTDLTIKKQGHNHMILPILLIGLILLGVMAMLSFMFNGLMPFLEIDLSPIVQTEYELFNFLMKRLLIGLMYAQPIVLFISGLLIFKKRKTNPYKEWSYVTLFFGIFIFITLNTIIGLFFIIPAVLGLMDPNINQNPNSIKDDLIYYILLLVALIFEINLFFYSFRIMQGISSPHFLLDILVITIIEGQILFYIYTKINLLFHIVKLDVIDSSTRKTIHLFLGIFIFIQLLFIGFRMHLSYIILLLPITIFFIWYFFKALKKMKMN